MQPGQILVADHSGVYIIKMIGDVRLTLCVSFDQFIKNMFAEGSFTAIVFDLSDAVAVDSTTLGLMAKIALQAYQTKDVRPIIITSSAGILRVLDCMGFSEIFEILKESELPQLDANSGTELVADVSNEALSRQKVLEAHRILMSLNEKNQSTFKDLVKMLEEES